jgi:serine protease AprX
LGIANQADLVGFQAGIIDASGDVRFESVTVLEAFNYALEKQVTHNLRIVTNSWGANGAFDPKSPIQQATFNMYKAGLVVTFAAGNEGREGEGTLNKYCVAPWVLCVGAADYLHRRAAFSSMGTDSDVSNKPYDHPDVVAPGVQIMAARAGTETDGVTGVIGGVTGGSGENLYVAKSGTSMATPHVAGLAALLLEANKDLSPDQVYDILAGTTTPMPGHTVWEVGTGYVNAIDAYKLADKTDGEMQTFKQGKVKYGGPQTGDDDYSEDPVTVGFGQGLARELRGSDLSVAAFAESLVSTTQGIIFLAGTIILAVFAFRFRR